MAERSQLLMKALARETNPFALCTVVVQRARARLVRDSRLNPAEAIGVAIAEFVEGKLSYTWGNQKPGDPASVEEQKAVPIELCATESATTGAR